LPERAAAPKRDKDRAEENRRVEILSDNPKILAPILLTNTEKVVDPPIARFMLRVKSEYPIAKWSVTANQPSLDTLGLEFIAKQRGDLPPYIDWDFSENAGLIPDASLNMTYGLEVTDDDDNTKSIQRDRELNFDLLTVQKKKRDRIADKYYDKYNMILFDFANFSLGEENDNIIKYIKDRLTDKSLVFIKGTTDKIGSPMSNLTLSQERANAVRDALGVPVEDCTGLGVIDVITPVE
jgi:outer membrane protein OmpA-like peptidoglycan-associated protein